MTRTEYIDALLAILKPIRRRWELSQRSRGGCLSQRMRAAYDVYGCDVIGTFGAYKVYGANDEYVTGRISKRELRRRIEGLR